MKYVSGIIALAAASPAFAQEPAPICTDRPAKSNAVCTVPEGAVQIESDLSNWTRFEAGGAKVDTIVPVSPTVKFGLGPNTDLQINWAPYVDVRTSTGGFVDRKRGAGDVLVRLKQRLTNADSKVQVGVIPFAKAPAAKRGIGNGEWEGGVALPVQFSLPQSFTLTFGPEIDLFADGDGSGKHAQLTGSVNIAKPVSSKLTLIGEFWTAQNYDPAGTVRQYSADVAATYLLNPKAQLDAGANFGLNRITPSVQLYLGISTRF